MRTLVLALVGLLAFALLPSSAQAQSQSRLTIAMEAPAEVFTPDTNVVTFGGFVTYTGDPLAYAQLNGIPIYYTVTRSPAWLSVTVNPASDVIPVGGPTGITYTATRAFHVTAILDPNYVGDAVDQIEIEVTQSASFLMASSSAKNAVPVVADVAEEPCELGGHEALLDAAVEAANTYRGVSDESAADVGAGRPESADPELITQDTSSKPLALPWIAVAGFALVGAGVGLALRRRFH